MINCTDNLAQKCNLFEVSILSESPSECILHSVQKYQEQISNGQTTPKYKFALIDLDDPSTLMTGIETLIGKVKTLNSKVIVTSSSCSERLVSVCKENRVTFMPKPINPNNL